MNSIVSCSLLLAVVYATTLVVLAFPLQNLGVISPKEEAEAYFARGNGKLPFSAELPAIPGLSNLGHGMNALTGQPSELLVKWTYNIMQQTYYDANTDTTYKVPDQFSVSAYDVKKSRVVSTISDSFETAFSEHYSAFHFSVGIQTPTFGLGVGFSHELQKIKQLWQGGVNFWASSHYYLYQYTAQFLPAYVLNKYGFQSLQLKFGIDALPSTCDGKNKTDCNQFIQSYGTHYICSAYLGGRMSQYQFLNKSFEKQYGKTTCATQFSLSFSFDFFNISGGGYQNRSQIKLAQWFKQNAKAVSFWEGGLTKYWLNSTLDLWEQTLPQLPVIVNATLCPIQDLISDSTKATNLKKYIFEYIKTENHTKSEHHV